MTRHERRVVVVMKEVIAKRGVDVPYLVKLAADSGVTEHKARNLIMIAQGVR